MQEPQSQLSNVYVLISSKQWSQALAAVNERLTAAPENAELLYVKAFILAKSKRHKQAEQTIVLAIEKTPYKADYYALLAFLYQQARRSEHAHYVADYGLSLEPRHITCLSLKALALTTLFRLEEAHTAIQELRAARQTTAAPSQGNALVMEHDDPEILFERALEIDPFRTKTRQESFATMAAKMPLGRFVQNIMPDGRAKTFRGLLILCAIIAAIAYFFRDQATYRSFSPMVLVAITVLCSRKAMSFAGNLPFLYAKPYRSFIQRYDIKLAVRILILCGLSVAALVCWHEFKSFTGLVFAVLFAAGVQSCEEKFATGRNATGLAIPTPPAPKQKKTARAPEVIDYETASFEGLYLAATRTLMAFAARIIRINLFVTPVVLLAVLIWPIVFWILYATDILVNYNYLLWPVVGLLSYFQFFVIWFPLFDLPIIHPREVRKFIPVELRKEALKMLCLELLSIASLVACFVLQDNRVLWLTLLVFIVVLQQNVTRGKRIRVAFEKYNTDETLKQELRGYVQERARALATVQQATASGK